MQVLIWAILGAGIGYSVGGFDTANDAILGGVIGLGAGIVLSFLVLAVTAGFVKKNFDKF